MVERTKLFRTEALEARGSPRHGSILLTEIGNTKAVAAIFLVFAICIVSFFYFMQTTRKVSAQGILIPSAGIYPISSIQPGTVKDILVKEGQDVERGQLIAVLVKEQSNSLSRNTGDSLTELLKSRERNIAGEIRYASMQNEQQIAVLQKKSRDLVDEIAQVNNQIELQDRRIALAFENEKRYQNLAKQNFISSAQVQQQQIDSIEQQQRRSELNRTVENLKRDLSNVKMEISHMRVQLERDKLVLERNKSQISEQIAQNQAEQESFIRATRAGKVTAIVVSIGQLVGANEALATVIPNKSPLEAEVYVTSHAVGFINPGVRATLRYQAFPYQKFGVFNAVVMEVSSTSLRPDELRLPRTVVLTGEQPLYRIKLKLSSGVITAYGKEISLKSGMVLDASFQLDRRRLVDWILDPLYTITGRL
ncbi:HlyD family efflux transporter periplasmic adaptor subunit [Oxalobacteraceae sp. CFBP 13730]|nr:HlyD family efflux transporter periplasmic adaptor subunit [Oxalobacteraceae sp. CFBP 13730]